MTAELRLTRFDFDPAFPDDLLASPLMADLLDSFGPDLEGGAKSRVREDTGDLSDSIHYDVDRDEQGLYQGRLNADDFKAAWYEFGSARTPADAYLRSTVEDVVGPVTGGDK